MNMFWKRFRTSSQKAHRDLDTEEALHQFGDAPTWKQMYGILKEWGGVILTDNAKGNIWASTDWEQLLTLLWDVRVNGIDEAWESFMKQQCMAELALDAFIRATTDRKRYAVLKVWQETLTSDATIVILLGRIADETAVHDMPRAALLDQLLQLLLDCRQRDIPATWTIL
jgi:hypothetical protein